MFWSPNDKIVVPSLHKITILMIVVDRLIKMIFFSPFSLIWLNKFFIFLVENKGKTNKIQAN